MDVETKVAAAIEGHEAAKEKVSTLGRQLQGAEVNAHVAEKELARVIQSTGKPEALFSGFRYRVIDTDHVEVTEYKGLIIREGGTQDLT